ncbi:hypothetical protein CP8484711_1759, partial [Chlamydia psittaci 84-8471/1]
MLLLLLQYHQN